MRSSDLAQSFIGDSLLAEVVQFQVKGREAEQSQEVSHGSKPIGVRIHHIEEKWHTRWELKVRGGSGNRSHDLSMLSMFGSFLSTLEENKVIVRT